MEINSKFFEKYPWIRSITGDPEYLGIQVRTAFDPYEYEDLFDTQTGSWLDPAGEEVDSYFEVDGVTVDMHSGSFYIESKDDDDIFKVLQYIDETIS